MRTLGGAATGAPVCVCTAESEAFTTSRPTGAEDAILVFACGGDASCLPVCFGRASFFACRYAVSFARAISGKDRMAADRCSSVSASNFSQSSAVADWRFCCGGCCSCVVGRGVAAAFSNDVLLSSGGRRGGGISAALGCGGAGTEGALGAGAESARGA